MAARTHVRSITDPTADPTADPAVHQQPDPALAALPARPVLSTALRRCWRDKRSLQFGRPSTSAVVLSGLDPGARRCWPSSMAPGRPPRCCWTWAAGCPRPRTLRLLTLLQEAGLLEDAAQGHPALAALSTAQRDRLAGWRPTWPP